MITEPYSPVVGSVRFPATSSELTTVSAFASALARSASVALPFTTKVSCLSADISFLVTVAVITTVVSTTPGVTLPSLEMISSLLLTHLVICASFFFSPIVVVVGRTRSDVTSSAEALVPRQSSSVRLISADVKSLSASLSNMSAMSSDNVFTSSAFSSDS